ncbi:hypothetical protein JMJ77_0003905 [Colletotrichum scovillei]|uniref:Uncharacterized protein n=1 Tax=Colletotrichum scovillei TaxID=1209932 RepID=A0A9P7U8L3_9PEZI|nr:hypothetical protein JMJ77_0003905 [Colletotrichum scovillei]KAG7049152.1 hypothetical protein JMJ78_0013135 [Colletotrichum scovillei]KAG7063894.1 hypothetical protein JMJ76_0006942 [Colletotrichum scovillei]
MNDATSAPRNQSSGALDTLESATCVVNHSESTYEHGNQPGQSDSQQPEAA